MGTPEFGATILKKLLTKHEIVLVVTQPDKKVGRKQIIEYSPVKKVALEHGLKIFQPQSIRKEEQYILNFDFDIIVTAAYGQIVGTRLLQYPRYKAINVHASLLPKYRGGAPVQRAIMNGEKETGITMMYMAKKMDAGDIITQKSIPITPEDNADTMFEKLANLGAEMILPALEMIESGTVNPQKQDETKVTYAYNLTKEDEKIDFNNDALNIYNQIRGLATNPGAYFTIDNDIFKVYHSTFSSLNSEREPGTIIEVTKDFFTIACGKGSITFTEIKPQGKNLMKVKDYLNGKGKQVIVKNRRV